MEAIVLAGGFGTRLQSVVKDVPKPMADVNGKPFLQYLLDILIVHGVTRVILSVGYKKEAIEKFFTNQYKNLEIVYSKEDDPLGTGGAIKQAFTLVKEQSVFVLNGDTFLNVNLHELHNKHIALQSDITLSLKKMYDFDRYGSVTVEGEYVVSFNEKKFLQQGLINGGVYMLNKTFLDNYPSKFSFETDVLEQSKGNLKIGFIQTDGYFIDIGIPSDYQKAIYDFGDKKALFLDRDGIINKDIKYLYRIEDFEFIEGIFELCHYFQSRRYKLFVITNQAGIGRGYYSEDDFAKLSQWMIKQFNNQEIEIEEVLYCLHHPTEAKGEYLQDCSCRKPKPGMLLEAQKRHAMSLKNSILIGDKQSDIVAGIRAGIETNILIKSHYQEEYDFESLALYLEYLKRNDI